ncbi:MAG: 4Fe-4S binding protein [Firmicutes bacterium]|nr:4Fe-4S binding protein [Bacillota bacterium]
MKRVVFNEERCKACELCVAVCPRKIINLSERINRMGFRSAEVREQDKCTSCTLCARMCPHIAIEVYREGGAAVG